MVRFQVEIEDNELKEIESLMEVCRIRKKKDLFNNALSLFRWAIKQRKEGWKIMAVNESEKRFGELEMPALSAVRGF